MWISRNSIAQDLLGKRSAIYSDRSLIPALEQDNRTSGQYLPLMNKNGEYAGVVQKKVRLTNYCRDVDQAKEFAK